MVKQYSLSELCLCIDKALHAELMPTYWVRAEIASLAIRGHCYIELVEKSSGNAIAAKVRATCWNHVYNLLAPFFAHETGQSLAIGMQVLLEVEIHFHAVFHKFLFIFWRNSNTAHSVKAHIRNSCR